MVGPEGRDSPSPIGPLLIWQQPHPIFYAELCHQTRKIERLWNAMVRSFSNRRSSWPLTHSLIRPTTIRPGPPLIPAQENHPPRETWNPTSSWLIGLKDWILHSAGAKRLGLKRQPQWDRVICDLSSLPVRDGVYLAHEDCPQTYTERNHDHPSMLAALACYAVMELIGQ